MAQKTLPAPIQVVIDDILPQLRALGAGRCAVSIGGSYGRGNYDDRSDLDFRLFCDAIPPASDEYTRKVEQLAETIRGWEERGITIDKYWVRIIKEVDDQLDQWCAGTIDPWDTVWTIWGYHPLTDIYHQHIIDDPCGIIAGWQASLRTYPPALKQALLAKHLRSIRYWRKDYHFQSKVQRQDVVFLVGLTSKLIHELIQILFALNETYYVGDGNNLAYVQKLPHIPENFAAKVEAILMLQPADDSLMQQNQCLFDLIDEVEALIERLNIQF